MDWTKQISEFMVDPFKSEFQQGLLDDAEKGIHSVGHVTVTASLVDVGASEASLRGCIDTSHQSRVDANGHTVKVGNGPNAYWRYIEVAHMVREGSTWKLASVDSHWNESC